jgi:hypothetical protein
VRTSSTAATDLSRPPIPDRQGIFAVTLALAKGKPRVAAGWTVVLCLTLVELAAVTHGTPSAIRRYPALGEFVTTVGQWVPMVQSFDRCAAASNAGTGLMLALMAVFFPIKLAAIYYAHPQKLSNPDRGWRGAFGMFYVVLFALVGLVPAYVFGWIFSPGGSGLASIDRKTSLLCGGGLPAFVTGTMQSSFALLCAYASACVLVFLLRSLDFRRRGTA